MKLRVHMNVVPRSTSELILCFTICVHSAMRHNIHMYLEIVLRGRWNGNPYHIAVWVYSFCSCAVSKKCKAYQRSCMVKLAEA